MASVIVAHVKRKRTDLTYAEVVLSKLNPRCFSFAFPTNVMWLPNKVNGILIAVFSAIYGEHNTLGCNTDTIQI